MRWGDKEKEKSAQHTPLVLRLVPCAIAAYVLRLLVLVRVSTAAAAATVAAEHLVEEAELEGGVGEVGEEEGEDGAWSWHGWVGVVLSGWLAGLYVTG